MYSVGMGPWFWSGLDQSVTKTPLVLRPKFKHNAGLDKINQDRAIRALMIVLFWFFSFSNSLLIYA